MTRRVGVNSSKNVWQTQTPTRKQGMASMNSSPSSRENFSTGGASSSSASDTALLLQSAARSLLDDSPGSAVSDGEEENGGNEVHVGNQNKIKEPLRSPTLRSLQKKTLPALPEEQDRKRFAGCLAAVLACTYEYDNAENDFAEDAESMAYLDKSEQSRRDEECEEQAPPTADLDASGSFDYYSVDDNQKQNKRDRRDAGRRELALRRHRKRRYDVMSKFLVSSAELLRIEKGQAKAFLPMLAKLLVPEGTREQPNLEKQKTKPPLGRRSSSPVARTAKDAPMASPQSGARLAETETEPEESVIGHYMDRIEHLRPFLESLTPGAGYRCLSLLLLQHLMHSREGYDARIRRAIKTLGVLVLIHDMENDPVDVYEVARNCRKGNDQHSSSKPSLVTLATRKFESLENAIAARLIELSRQQEEAKGRKGARQSKNGTDLRKQSNGGYSKEQILRGLKIGGTAVVAGTLFAVTGGIAAPGIAAGLATIAGGTAVTAAAVAVLNSAAAVTTIFGIGGGGLAAYKMQRRTQGLTEFEFVKETGKQRSRGEISSATKDQTEDIEAELFSTICMSGWLRDEYDFQRPWGVFPSHPRLTDRQELLERFYSVYRPDNVPRARKILASWKGEESELWKLLGQKYGRDPDHLFPLEGGPRCQASLTLEQQEVIDQLFVELDYAPSKRDQRTPFEGRRSRGSNRPFGQVNHGSFTSAETPTTSEIRVAALLDDSLDGPHTAETVSSVSIPDGASVGSSGFESVPSSVSVVPSNPTQDETQDNSSKALPKHLSTVWDYQTNYGGELYTVRWEPELLTDVCDTVADLAKDLVSSGTAQLLKHTVLGALMSAIAWPYALVNAANMIDGTWTLCVERSDAAGRELARSLLFSRAGHRPVTLIGFSFGARAIYSCLKQLARYQEGWEDFRERNKGKASKLKNGSSTGVDAKDGSDEFYQYMREPASIVEDVVIMGLPNHLSLSSWEACRRVVAGRLVNCFSQRDLILSLMFQFKRLGLKPVCGTCPVNVRGVENIDLTDIIAAHEDYCLLAGDILERVKLGQPFRSQPLSYNAHGALDDRQEELTKDATT